VAKSCEQVDDVLCSTELFVFLDFSSSCLQGNKVVVVVVV
jgi:hypothetical protein